MSKIIQRRLAALAEELLTESQCGFRRDRSTIDMIFSFRQNKTRAIEQNQELYVIFAEFKKNLRSGGQAHAVKDS